MIRDIIEVLLCLLPFVLFYLYLCERGWKYEPTKYHSGSKLLWLFPEWVEAVTIGRHIFFRDYLPLSWLIDHEAVHVRQYREHGIIKFLWIYFIKEWKLPYKKKSFEVEAYEISSPPVFDNPHLDPDYKKELETKGLI